MLKAHIHFLLQWQREAEAAEAAKKERHLNEAMEQVAALKEELATSEAAAQKWQVPCSHSVQSSL